MSEVDQIRAQALEVAGGWSPPDAPESWRLTAALFTAIGGHEELLEALSELPPDRLPALLASAAISYLVRRDQRNRLARYFPDPGQVQPAFDSGFYAPAAGFISARLPDIVAVCRQHRYQMNEVARCTQVALGIAAMTTPGNVPVALVDLGTGAGLGLQLDRYRYLIGGQLPVGPVQAGLTLACELHGAGQPPAPDLPQIASRVGIELDPVDLEEPAARAWLEACAPPEASALTRLAQAIKVARGKPASIVVGDVVDRLPEVLAELPADSPVIVTDAYLAVFLPDERRALLTEIMARAGHGRPVTWLSLSPLVPLGPTGHSSVQGLTLPGKLVSDYQQNGVFAVLGAHLRQGNRLRGPPRPRPPIRQLGRVDRLGPVARNHRPPLVCRASGGGSLVRWASRQEQRCRRSWSVRRAIRKSCR